MELNKRFSVKIISEAYPRTFAVLDKLRVFHELIYICTSPTSNCQSISIGQIDNLVTKTYTKEEIEYIFELIWTRCGKSQVILDIKECYLKSVLKILKPFIARKYCRKYISTNGSKMNLIIIQLDVDKLQ